MGAGYEHLLPISLSVTSVRMEARCTEAGADAACSLAVAWLGQDRVCLEEELVLPGMAHPGLGETAPSHSSHGKFACIRLCEECGNFNTHETLTHHDHSASISTLPSNTVFTCFVCSYGPEAASVTQLKPRAFGVPCSALGTCDNE